MKKRKESERTMFERWWCEEHIMLRAELRELRTENGGYSDELIDYAWIGWANRAAMNVGASR